LSGSDPKRDLQLPADKSVPSAPPTLVFKPDVRQQVRVARVRMYTLMAAGVLMVVALLLIASYRPPPVVLTKSEPARDTVAFPEGEAAVSAAPASQIVSVPRRVTGIDIARSAAAAIDTLVGTAAEKWVRASELLPPGVVTRDNAEEAAAGLRRAVVLADSARRAIALAQGQAELVLRAAREAQSGPAFRLSVFYTAVDRYLKLLDQDAADRLAFYAKSELSVKASLAGDQSEAETQQNVANSYLRRSEDRQAGIKRLAEQSREALRNVENAGR